MTKQDEQKLLTQRIDELEDARFADLKSHIDDKFKTQGVEISNLERLLVGNGQPGIIKTVASNSSKIKIIMWTVGIIVSLALTAYLGGTKQAKEIGFELFSGANGESVENNVIKTD